MISKCQFLGEGIFHTWRETWRQRHPWNVISHNSYCWGLFSLATFHQNSNQSLWLTTRTSYTLIFAISKLFCISHQLLNILIDIISFRRKMPDSTSKIGRNVIALKHKSIIIEKSQKSPSSFQSCKPRCRVDFQQAPTSHSEVRLKTIGGRVIWEISANVCSQISYSTISVSPICTKGTWDISHLLLLIIFSNLYQFPRVHLGC